MATIFGFQRSNHGQDMSTPLPRELQSAAFLDRLMARFRHVVEAKLMGIAVASDGWVEKWLMIKVGPI